MRQILFIVLSFLLVGCCEPVPCCDCLETGVCACDDCTCCSCCDHE